MHRFFKHLNTALSFTLYSSVATLPNQWDDLASDTIFLSSRYLRILEESAPENMECFYIGIFENQNLRGIAIAQFLDGNSVTSFGNRDRCIKTAVRNFAFKNFSSQILFIGNNMLTGQNAFSLDSTINVSDAIKTLRLASIQIEKQLKKRGKKVHLTSFKDFNVAQLNDFKEADFSTFYQFEIQPNMIFEIDTKWNSMEDYVGDLHKKYRDQYKRAQKKSSGIEKRKLSLEEIVANEDTVYNLYYHVAKNAPFNTFFLRKNHFATLKKHFQHDFLFYGYFLNNQLIGFNTLIKNGTRMETYFLGYDEQVQRDTLLYLNMLYDMIGYSIKKRFKKIIFGRTALEIKSSVGAEAEPMYGFIKHSNPIVQWQMPSIFNALQPKISWQKRNPFKENN